MGDPLIRERAQDVDTGTVYDIAIVGTRGVPANYGGFETFAEELGARLVGRGIGSRSTGARATSETNHGSTAGSTWSP